MKKKKGVVPYCVQYKGLFTAKTFDDVIKKLYAISEKYSSEDYDEVLAVSYTHLTLPTNSLV